MGMVQAIGAGALLVGFLVAGGVAGPGSGRAAGGDFDLPADDDAVVIRLVEDRGPLEPAFQTGYEIEITAGGQAIYTITPTGASPDLDEPELDQVVLEVDLSDDDLDDLLEELDERGYFALAEGVDPDDEPPPGSAVSFLAVTLDDEWLVHADVLAGDDRRRLVDAQQAVVAAVLAALGEETEDDERFDLPDGDETVIEVIANNGPLPPEYQSGYTIEIDASGGVEAEFTPEGASPDVEEPTGEPERWRYDLDEEGLYGLLVVLDELGLFDLSPAADAEIGEGDSVVVLRVTLDDEELELDAYELEGADRDRFAAIRTAITAAAGVDDFPTPLF